MAFTTNHIILKYKSVAALIKKSYEMSAAFYQV